jgi:hypothetical protein
MEPNLIAFRGDGGVATKQVERVLLGGLSRHPTRDELVDREVEMRLEFAVDLSCNAQTRSHARPVSSAVETAPAYRFHRTTSARSCWRPAGVSE